MSIKWTTVYTEKNYRFEAKLLSQSPYTFLLREDPKIDHVYSKSLTNAMDEVLEHLIIGVGPDICKTMQVYQWCEGEGLFKIEWYLSKKHTRDMPPWRISDVKWYKIADDLKAFEVLYG